MPYNSTQTFTDRSKSVHILSEINQFSISVSPNPIQIKNIDTCTLLFTTIGVWIDLQAFRAFSFFSNLKKIGFLECYVRKTRDQKAYLSTEACNTSYFYTNTVSYKIITCF